MHFCEAHDNSVVVFSLVRTGVDLWRLEIACRFVIVLRLFICVIIVWEGGETHVVALMVKHCFYYRCELMVASCEGRSSLQWGRRWLHQFVQITFCVASMADGVEHGDFGGRRWWCEDNAAELHVGCCRSRDLWWSSSGSFSVRR